MSTRQQAAKVDELVEPLNKEVAAIWKHLGRLTQDQATPQKAGVDERAVMQLVDDLMSLREETKRENSSLKQQVSQQQEQIEALVDAQRQQAQEIQMLLKNQRAHQALLIPDNSGIGMVGTPTLAREIGDIGVSDANAF